MRASAMFYGSVLHSEADKASQLVVMECSLNGTTRSFAFPSGFKVSRGDRFRVRYWEPSKASARPVVSELTDPHGFPLWDSSAAQ